MLCHCVYSVSAMQTLSSLSYRNSLAVNSAVFSFSDCQEYFRNTLNDPFGIEEGPRKRDGAILLIPFFFVLFQVLMTSLY